MKANVIEGKKHIPLNVLVPLVKLEEIESGTYIWAIGC